MTRQLQVVWWVWCFFRKASVLSKNSAVKCFQNAVSTMECCTQIQRLDRGPARNPGHEWLVQRRRADAWRVGCSQKPSLGSKPIRADNGLSVSVGAFRKYKTQLPCSQTGRHLPVLQTVLTDVSRKAFALMRPITFNWKSWVAAFQPLRFFLRQVENRLPASGPMSSGPMFKQDSICSWFNLTT